MGNGAVSIDSIFSITDLQNITDSVGNLINSDIVIFNHQGVIIAATNRKRLGIRYSYISKMLDSGEDSVIVESEDNPEGIKPGISVPLLDDGKPIGAVGITAATNEAKLLIKIIQNLVQKNLTDIQNEKAVSTARDKYTGFIYNWMLNGKYSPEDGFYNRSRELDIEIGCSRIVCAVRPCSADSIFSDSDLLNRIYQSAFETIRAVNRQNIAACINDKIIILLKTDSPLKAEEILNTVKRKVLKVFGITLACGIVSEPFINSDLKAYCEIADAACDSSGNSESKETVVYGVFGLEYLLSSIKPEYRNKFAQYQFRGCKSPGQIREFKTIILSYVKNNKSIQKVSEELNMHINTVQYKLNKIKEITGYNPRLTEELVPLYLVSMM